jgi:hypothetical protein
LSDFSQMASRITVDPRVAYTARVSVRLFRLAVTERQAGLAKTLAEDETKSLIREFVMRSTTKGRDRALARLRRRIDPFASFADRRLHGDPRALWQTIVLQDGGAAVWFLTIDRHRGVTQDVWNFACAEHAITRFYQRGGQDLVQALFEANAGATNGKLYRKRGVVMITAGPGAFSCVAEVGGFDRAGRLFGKTWLHSDQMYDDQEANLGVITAAA